MNASGGSVHSYVDVTNTAIVANLPADVIKILPWAPVANGPTGAMPQDFWQKIGAITTPHGSAVPPRDVFKRPTDDGIGWIMKDYRKIAEEFARHVKSKYGDRIDRIILFGSVARGDYREDSDIDLLVVARGDRLALQDDLSHDMTQFLLRDGVAVVPLVLSTAEAARLPATGFGREVAREGFAVA